jgi:hypothetical protein
MAAGRLTPEREEQLTADLLRERVGIDPDKAGPVLDLAAIGLVNGAWRNTCVENWHAEGRLHDDLSAEPADVADRARLRRLLLSRPWELGADAAQWLVNAGIRYVRVS